MKIILKKYKDYFIVFSVTLLLLFFVFFITGFFTDSSTLISGDLQAHKLMLLNLMKNFQN